MTKSLDPRSISKILSANDTGETGAHQAGILVPKDPDILGFFPTLTKETLNPREFIYFTDDDGYRWEFSFIYYNNRFYNGTRNEFRLTRMTPYIKKMGLKSGDEIIFVRDEKGRHYIHNKKIHRESNNGTIKLSSTWKVVAINKRN